LLKNLLRWISEERKWQFLRQGKAVKEMLSCVYFKQHTTRAEVSSGLITVVSPGDLRQQ